MGWRYLQKEKMGCIGRKVRYLTSIGGLLEKKRERGGRKEKDGMWEEKEERRYFDVDGWLVVASPDGDTCLDASEIAVLPEKFFIFYPFTTLPCVIAWQRRIY